MDGWYGPEKTVERHLNWLITLWRVIEFHLKIVFVDNSRAFQDFEIIFFGWMQSL